MNCNTGCMDSQWANIDTFPVAMGYVPWQFWETTYEPDKALEVGTIFPELNKPFLGWKGACK